ncbi:MAG: hypothetical protein HY775_03070 [Acidobacteria bacterium]|nr:hypothetical protein [Acidobacteriota bacterium]
MRRDVLATTRLTDDIVPRLTPEGIEYVVTRLGVPIGSRGVALRDEDRISPSAGAITVLLADLIQHYYVIDELWEAWPKCPAHEHPLEAAVVKNEAVWRCPADGSAWAPIGELGSLRSGRSGERG